MPGSVVCDGQSADERRVGCVIEDGCGDACRVAGVMLHLRRGPQKCRVASVTFPFFRFCTAIWQRDLSPRFGSISVHFLRKRTRLQRSPQQLGRAPQFDRGSLSDSLLRGAPGPNSPRTPLIGGRQVGSRQCIMLRLRRQWDERFRGIGPEGGQPRGGPEHWCMPAGPPSPPPVRRSRGGRPLRWQEGSGPRPMSLGEATRGVRGEGGEDGGCVEIPPPPDGLWRCQCARHPPPPRGSGGERGRREGKGSPIEMEPRRGGGGKEPVGSAGASATNAAPPSHTHTNTSTDLSEHGGHPGGAINPLPWGLWACREGAPPAHASDGTVRSPWLDGAASPGDTATDRLQVHLQPGPLVPPRTWRGQCRGGFEAPERLEFRGKSNAG